MFNLETAIPNETLIIKVTQNTHRVPVGSILTFRSVGSLLHSFNTVELGSYGCSPRYYEELS